MMDIRAVFRKQGDGSWKLAGFTSYKYGSNELFPIPNLGR
jgi:ketosteroid isomerase-like protein